MNFKVIRYRTEERIAFITLHRPEKRNALNGAVVTELKEAFSLAEKEPGVKVIVLSASGKVFSAGADLAYLRELQANSHEENLADSRNLRDLFLQIYTCSKTVIAQVQGHAIAGGCGLVSVCDLCFSVPEARFGYTEARIGFVPALVAPFLLLKTGESRARELLITGELVDAVKAREYGLVNYIVQPEALEEAVRDLSMKLAAETSANSVAATKELLASLKGLPLAKALDLAAEVNARIRAGKDFRKGVEAFLNKETPDW